MHKPLHCLGLTGSDVTGVALSTDGQQRDFVDRWMSQSTRDLHTPYSFLIQELMTASRGPRGAQAPSVPLRAPISCTMLLFSSI